MIFQSKNQFWKSSGGAVAVLSALVFPVLLGFASLGVEVGHWYLDQRVMQGSADAAAISAAAQYIADSVAGNPSSTTYKQVGVNYASVNGGFMIPTSNVCLWKANGDCASILSLDSRAIVCNTAPCMVVEITQNTALWLTTKFSLEPNGLGKVKAIPTPILAARAVVWAKENQQIVTTAGTDCILALANDPQAIRVHGNGDPSAQCGVAIDGGLTQNAGTPIQGGITFNGANAKVNINALVVAAATANCPDGGAHCQQYNSSAALTNVVKSTATPDPYAAQITALFQTTPLGVQTGGVAIKAAGSGYTNGTCTFTVSGGTYYTPTASPAKFTATISGGKVTGTPTVIDPGAYATFPPGTVSATSTCGGSGATFTLTEGCWTWNSTLFPVVQGVPQALTGRKYCSINLLGSGTTNFPAGSYWIAGGDSGCAGFCVSSNQATVTSAVAGVTFFLTNGDGAHSLGSSSYATASITSGNVNLCAPGTNCSTTCSNAAGPTSCMLFIQNPAATVSTSLDTPGATVNSFAGNGARTLSGLIYLPKQTFSETGNGPILGCVAVIAKYFDIGGTPTFADGCLPGNGIGGGTTTITTFSKPFLTE
jgi:hypothetical protein